MDAEQLLKELSERMDDLSDSEREFIESASDAVFGRRRQKLLWNDEKKVFGIWKRVMRK